MFRPSRGSVSIRFPSSYPFNISAPDYHTWRMLFFCSWTVQSNWLPHSSFLILRFFLFILYYASLFRVGPNFLLNIFFSSGFFSSGPKLELYVPNDICCPPRQLLLRLNSGIDPKWHLFAVMNRRLITLCLSFFPPLNSTPYNSKILSLIFIRALLLYNRDANNYENVGVSLNVFVINV